MFVLSLDSRGQGERCGLALHATGDHLAKTVALERGQTDGGMH